MTCGSTALRTNSGIGSLAVLKTIQLVYYFKLYTFSCLQYPDIPSSRTGSFGTTNNSTHLWLYGGVGTALLTELWQYHIDTNRWTLLSNNPMYISSLFSHLTVILVFIRQLLAREDPTTGQGSDTTLSA